MYVCLNLEREKIDLQTAKFIDMICGPILSPWLHRYFLFANMVQDLLTVTNITKYDF